MRSNTTTYLGRVSFIAVSGTLVLSLVVLLLGFALQLGIWTRTEIFQGPFSPEAAPSRICFIALGRGLRPRELLNTGGDVPSSPFQSDLKLWVNGQLVGPAHGLHEEIRKTGDGRYSHWGDALLLSLPDGVPNSPSTRIVAEYSPKLRDGVFHGALFGLLLGAAYFGVRSWRNDRDSFLRKGTLAIRTTGLVFEMSLAATLLGAGAYLLTVLYGIAQGFFFPNTAVFTLAPWTRDIAAQEPYSHYLIALYAMVGAVLSWLAALTPQWTDALRRREDSLQRLCGRYGFFAVLALYLFSVGATWHGIPRPYDLNGSAIGGLVPFLDAHSYFQATFLQVINNDWGSFGDRRPFATVHRNVLMFLSGYSSTTFLFVQTVTLTAVTYFAARAVMNWRGIWAGLTFFALSFALVRPYLTTNLTEPLGLFWALLAIPFIVRALRTGLLVDGAAGFLATSVALFTRMGSMFTIPAFGIWLAWNKWRDKRRLKFAILAVVAVLAVCVGESQLLNKLYGSGKGALGSNYSYSVCGLTHGGDWTTCLSLYPVEGLERRGATEAEIARYLYLKAWEKFQREPSIFINRLAATERFFVDNVLERAFVGYTYVPIPRRFPIRAWELLAVAGLIFVLGRRRERRELSFWVFMALGILASAPLVIMDDGWRVLSASFPLIALFLACGFSTPATMQPPRDLAETSWKPKLALWGMFLVLASWLVVPGFAHWLDPIGARALKSVTAAADERIVLGGRYMAGYLVVPDGEPVPIRVPAMHLSEFRKILEYSGNEQYQKLTVPSSSAAFGFVATPSARRWHHEIFMVPPEVIYRRDVTAWRFKLADGPESESRIWAHVSSATPVAPVQR